MNAQYHPWLQQGQHGRLERGGDANNNARAIEDFNYDVGLQTTSTCATRST
jgi:hypothetical protein